MTEKEFFEQLSALLQGRVVLMGVDNGFRRDDVAGSLLARGLGGTETFLPIDCGDLPENFTGPVKQFSPNRIVFVDSVDFGGQPGAIAFFELDSVASILGYLGKLFGLNNVDVCNFEALYVLRSNAVLLLIAAVGSVPLFRSIYKRYSQRAWVRALVLPAFYVVVLTVSVAYLVDSSFNPFLYFRF